MVTIRQFQEGDYPALKAIYQQGIDSGDATFLAQAMDWPEWNAAYLDICRLVAVEADRIAGWAALCKVSGRCYYGGVAEVSVYVANEAQGRGVGHALLSALVSASERQGFWTLQAGIFPENKASLALHEKNGFRALGVRERLGRMNGCWRDVVLMERRSKVVGV